MQRPVARAKALIQVAANKLGYEIRRLPAGNGNITPTLHLINDAINPVIF